jgi:hypothetical protein
VDDLNPRRVHELYRRSWPPFAAVSCEWQNLLPDPEPDPARIEEFVRRYIQSPTVLIHVSRKIGGEFELSEGVRFVCPYIGKYVIRFAARDFSSYVVIATPGVGAGGTVGAITAVQHDL